MKKVIFGALMLILVISASAQNYKVSLGINAGSFNGFSYKGFVTDHLVLQADLGVNLECTYGQVDLYENGSSIGSANGQQTFYTFEVNPNLLYQAEILSANAGTLSWFAGGGLSAGMMNSLDVRRSYPIFKWGLNGTGGIEFQLAQVPLAFSFDFRPGYGMSTYTIKNVNSRSSAVNSFFDWKMAVGIRYVFK